MKPKTPRQPASALDVVDLIDAMSEEGLISLHNMIIDRIRLLQRQRAKQSMLHFRIGDIVNFKTNEGEEITGVLVRMNKKSVTVHAENGHRWNVAPHILTKALDQLGSLSRDELEHEAHIHHIADKKVH